MTQGLTVDAVRLALALDQARARMASLNIAQANVPGAQPLRLDLTGVQPLLQAAAAGEAGIADLRDAAERVGQDPGRATGDAIQLDAEVAEMLAAGTEYQALADALGRHFGLMRLAISGKS